MADTAQVLIFIRVVVKALKCMKNCLIVIVFTVRLLGKIFLNVHQKWYNLNPAEHSLHM